MTSSHCISNDHVHRSPVSGYVTIGNVRVRLSASGSTVSQPGGDSECCCGVPWPSRSRSRSRIPLPNSANNRRGPSPVYRTSLEWTQQKAPNNVVTSCFGKDKTESAGVLVRPSYFRLCNAGADTDTQCLLQDQGDSPQLDALDRLHKFRFGGSDRARGGKRSNPAHKKKPRSSDKTERLRELTEKLKTPACSDKLKQPQPGPSGVSESPGTKQRLVPVIDYREKHKLVPLLDHKDKHRLVPLIDHKDKHKQVPFLDNKDKQKIVPLLDNNDKQKTVSLSEHRDKSKLVPLYDHKDRQKQVPFSELKDNQKLVPLIEHSDRQKNLVPFSEPNDNQILVPLLENSDKQKLVPLSEHNNNQNLDPLLDKGDNHTVVPLSDNKHQDDTFEFKEKTKPVPLVKQCCVGSVSEVNDIFECVNLRLPKPECRTIVGSYIQRSIPFRSASFSQVDFSPVDGKYIRSGRATTVDSGSLTFPRKKPSDNSPYISPSSSTTKDLNNDSSSNTWKESTVNHPSQDVPLEGVREESDTDSALAPSEPDQCLTLLTPEIVEIDTAHNHNTSSAVDEPISEITETVSVSESSVLNDNNNAIKEESQLNEDAVNNNAETPQIVEETYVAKWPDESKPDVISEFSHLKEIELPNVNNNNVTNITENKVQNENVSSEAYVEYKRWSDEGTSGDRTSNEWPSSAQEEPQSPEEVNVKLSWNVPKERKGKLWLERPRLVCQSSEEKEDDQVTRNSPKRYQLLTRADSLSEGESDPGDRRERDRTASPSLFAPSDQSDCESRFGGSGGNSKSPHPPRRYSKRPLRGPYGQMLEAEMKKPETRKFSKLQYNEDLKFLEDYVATPTRTIDDCHLKRSYTSPDPPQPRTSPKRKVSANIPYSAPNPPTSVCDTMPIVHHQRTTSSPSQLEGCSSNPKAQRPPQPSPQLLAQLLKGSSERVYMADIPSQNWKDTRTHVVVELYDTERSYVESLQILVMKYLQPLKSPENAGLVDVSLVDEIFYQVPTILTHHEEFLEELKKRLEHWDVKQRVGDIFLDTFTKQSVIETYTAFINNWKTAKEAIKTTCQAKPAFARFLEAMAREHKGKLALDSLLIMPVQRIPRYELLIQTLLKHTEPNHPDHQPLVEAQKQVHALAVRINCTERDSLELEQLEGLIEGLMHLVAPDRTFIRHDFVTMASGQGRKERAIFLFSDLLVITSIKRRSGTIRKSSTNCPGSVASALEANKYKLLMKISLEDLEIVKAKDENLRRMLREMDNLVEDVATLTQMSELVSTLHCPHSQLEDNIKEMLSALNKQLVERQNNEAQLSYLELMINTQSGIENISVIFSKPDKRSSWEEAFNEAKQRLALSADKRPSPEFMAPVPIRKTRAGLQFTCAAPTLNLNNGCRDVWVCNSDGYVGQVCVLSLNPEPTVTSCNGVCNARILCIAAIPAGFLEQPQRSSYIADSGISISVEDTDKSGTIHLESSSSSEEDESDDRHEVETGSNNKIMNSNLVNTSSSGQSGEMDDMDNLQPTMWLGTEDGCIHVYNCSDNIRIKKNKVKIQHGSAVHSIIYLENRVFVSLANGDISVYMREANGGWNTSDPYTVTVGTVSMPVTKMVPISGRLWCSCHSVIKVLNTATLIVEHSFNASGETQKCVSCIVVSGLGVWVSLQNSAIVRLFHANSFECLGEVNIAPSVTKMLASCDDIIRQHKAACLRVTSLLACKDLLWVGTSAGVVLTMPLPHISASTCKVTSNLTVSGVPHGHTGHVRFLTVVETKPMQSGDHHRIPNHNQSNKVDSSTNFKLLVISGGDGYEDFRSASMSEVAGREDSTNHLLLWHV